MNEPNNNSNQTSIMKVAILIPVKDDQIGLNETLRSIDRDAYCRTTIFVCDDGSADPVHLEFNLLNHDVVLHRNPNNVGISVTLNGLLDCVVQQDYDFAARIDAGDLWLSHRLKVQLEFMKKNPEVTVLGGAAIVTDINGSEIDEYIPKVRVEDLFWEFRTGYPIYHPTVIFRLKGCFGLKDRYPVNYSCAEDYALFYSLHKKNPNSIININRASHSVGVRRARRQAYAALRIRIKNSSIDDLVSILGLFDLRLIGRIISPTLYSFLVTNIKSITR
jgi:glycosyltransferase involved in cell wall biosynthesis